MKAIKLLKEAQEKGIDIRTLPPPPPSENLDFLACKHCNRKFKPDSHEKHEKICANVTNKPTFVKKMLPSSTNKNYKGILKAGNPKDNNKKKF